MREKNLGMTNAHFESIDEYKMWKRLIFFGILRKERRFPRKIRTSRLEIKGQCENSDAVG